jgi:hypothetical protein
MCFDLYWLPSELTMSVMLTNEFLLFYCIIENTDLFWRPYYVIVVCRGDL